MAFILTPGEERLKYFHARRLKPPLLPWPLDDLRDLMRAFYQVLFKSRREVLGHKRLYASSLAFKTVLALIPVLAIFMSLLASRDLSATRERILDQAVGVLYPLEADASADRDESKSLRDLNEAGKRRIREAVQKFADHSRRVGFLGLLGFALVVFFLLRDVEHSFNYLWGIPRARPFGAQTLRNAVLLFAGPLAAILAVTLKAGLEGLGSPGKLVHGWVFSGLFPFLGLWAFCAWLYAWVPNIRVERKAALWAGLTAAVLLQLGQWALTWYTLHFFRHSNVYGTFWVLPVILVWFYLAWTILLFGAEASSFFQRHQAEKRRQTGGRLPKGGEA
jgi:membrane protein